MRSGALLLQDVFQESYLSPSEVERKLAFALDVFKTMESNDSYTNLLKQKEKWVDETDDKSQNDTFRRWQRKLREEGAAKPLYARAGILFAQVLCMQAMKPNALLQEAAETSGCELNELRWEVLSVALYSAAMACEARVHAVAHVTLRRTTKYDPVIFGNARFEARENLKAIFNVTDDAEWPEALITFLETGEGVPSEEPLTVSQDSGSKKNVLTRKTIKSAMIDACKMARELGERDWREFYSGMIEAEEGH